MNPKHPVNTLLHKAQAILQWSKRRFTISHYDDTYNNLLVTPLLMWLSIVRILPNAAVTKEQYSLWHFNTRNTLPWERMGNDSTNSLIVRPYIKIVTPIQLPVTSLPPGHMRMDMIKERKYTLHLPIMKISVKLQIPTPNRPIQLRVQHIRN